MSQVEYLAKVSALGSTAYWSLSEGSGDLIDESGNGFDLTKVGGGTATYQQAGPFPGSFSINLDGSCCFNLTGTDHNDLPLPFAANITEYTGILWVNLDNPTSGNQVLLRQNSSTNETNYNFVQNASPDELRMDENPPSGGELGAASAISASTWYMVSMIKGASKRELWVNDTLVDSDASPEDATGLGGTLRYFNLGGRWNGSLSNAVTGNIAGPAVFDTALNAGDIQALYSAATSSSVTKEAEIPAFDPDPTDALSLEWVARQFRRLSDYLKSNYSFIFSHAEDLTNWNAHGNTATSDGSSSDFLKINDGSLWIDNGSVASPSNDATGEYPAGAEYQGSDYESKLLWIGDKGAFRCGMVNGTAWDDTNIGSYSFAAGLNAKAESQGCVALGTGAESGAGGAADVVAIGNQSQASATGTVAIGNTAVASNIASIAIGPITTANCLFGGGAIGYRLEANQFNSWVIGSGAGDTNRFTNDIASSMMFGVGLGSADTATLTLRNKRCGVNEENPLSDLDVGGSVGFKYDVILAEDGGGDTLSDEYVVLVDMQNVTSGNTHTITLPQLGATLDRRIYYIKMVDLSGTWSTTSANLDIVPNGVDQIENIDTGSSNAGTLKATPGDGVTLPTSASNRGATLTFIADHTNGGWWVI